MEMRVCSSFKTRVISYQSVSNKMVLTKEMLCVWKHSLGKSAHFLPSGIHVFLNAISFLFKKKRQAKDHKYTRTHMRTHTGTLLRKDCQN